MFLFPKQEVKQKAVKYSGAGGLLIDLKSNELILVKDQTGHFRDLGGSNSYYVNGQKLRKSCHVTASEEIQQESRGLIKVESKLLKEKAKHVNISAGETKY